MSTYYLRGLGSALLLATLSLPAGAADLSPDRLLAAGRVDDAMVSLQNQINRTPADAESYNLLCRAHFALGDWDAGISACQQAVALDRDNSQYHLWLGRIYGEKADHSNFFSAAGLAKKVRNEFETAVKLDPHNLEARSDLAEFYVEAPPIVGGGRDKAEAQAQEMTVLDPAQAHMVKARLAEKRDDFATAESEYRAAIQASGGRAGIWMGLVQFYSRRGQLDQMQEAVQHAVSVPHSQHVLMAAADVLVRTKRDLPTAIQLLRRYLSQGTVEDSPAFKAHYLLGTLLEQQGDTPGAVEQYRAALSLVRNFAPAQNALGRLQRNVARSKSTTSDAE